MRRRLKTTVFILSPLFLTEFVQGLDLSSSVVILSGDRGEPNSKSDDCRLLAGIAAQMVIPGYSRCKAGRPPRSKNPPRETRGQKERAGCSIVRCPTPPRRAVGK